LTNLETLQKIKRLTLSAFAADDILMGVLVLKGGNALDLAYDITNRGSIDIDFSIEKDFTENEKKHLYDEIESLLNNEFSKENLIAFDIIISERPEKIKDAVKLFWGGYLLEFKVISKNKFNLFNGDLESIRRNALSIHTDKSPKFTIDISKFEFTEGKRPRDIEGAVVFVYSPEMLAIEKLRALCQQLPSYKDIVLSMTPKSRARDFYDIYNIYQSFSINFKAQENVELCKHIFDAKKVPLNSIKHIHEQREFHRQSWDSVISTVDQKENLKDFDFYVDFVLDLFNHLN